MMNSHSDSVFKSIWYLFTDACATEDFIMKARTRYQNGLSNAATNKGDYNTNNPVGFIKHFSITYWICSNYPNYVESIIYNV